MTFDGGRNRKGARTSEVQLYHVEVRDNHRRLRRGFLVIVEPFAPQPLSLVPNLQQVLVVLHDHRVLVKLPVHVRLRSASDVR